MVLDARARHTSSRNMFAVAAVSGSRIGASRALHRSRDNSRALRRARCVARYASRVRRRAKDAMRRRRRSAACPRRPRRRAWPTTFVGLVRRWMTYANVMDVVPSRASS